LRGHIRNGNVPYVDVGLGKRYRLDESAVEAFKEANGHRNAESASCRSISPKTRHTINSTSKCEVVAFTALQNRLANAKPKRRNG
jgi:hypothetical protein